MKNSIRLDSRLASTLSLNQDMKQAISLLQMNNIELGEYLEQKSLDNPFLEIDRGYLPGYDRNNSASDEQDQFFSVPQAFCLRDSLKLQVAVSFEDQDQRHLGNFLIEQLDDAGLLPLSIQDIARITGLGETIIGNTLSTLKTFEPAGVFAQNMRECFTLQLMEKGYSIGQINQSLDYFYGLLDKNGAPAFIQQAFPQDMKELKKILRSVNAQLLQEASVHDTALLLPPDILVNFADGYVKAELNEQTSPQLHVNKGLYTKSMESSDTAVKRYVSCAFKEAQWLQKAVLERRKNVLKVIQSILDFQDQFMVAGFDALKPMHLQDIAVLSQLHESTVSRIVAHKTVETHWGVSQLRSFFSSGLQAVAKPDQPDCAVSAMVVKKKIKILISQEPEEAPFSDQDLVIQLKREGVLLARRTVSKYRESLNIPPSHLRKRYKLMGLKNAVAF